MVRTIRLDEARGILPHPRLLTHRKPRKSAALMSPAHECPAPVALEAVPPDRDFIEWLRFHRFHGIPEKTGYAAEHRHFFGVSIL
jgi:hypothetical protein